MSDMSLPAYDAASAILQFLKMSGIFKFVKTHMDKVLNVFIKPRVCLKMFALIKTVYDW